MHPKEQDTDASQGLISISITHKRTEYYFKELQESWSCQCGSRPLRSSFTMKVREDIVRKAKGKLSVADLH